MQVQVSSTKLVYTSVWTSTTAEVRTVPSKSALAPLLNVVSVVDVLSRYALFVCSDVIKDVATDATMNKAADQACVTTNIAMVVEEIIHENEKKILESDVIVDLAVDIVDETVGQSGVENDADMQRERKL